MPNFDRFIPQPVRRWLGIRHEDRTLVARRRAAGLCPECGEHEAAMSEPRCAVCQCDLGW